MGALKPHFSTPGWVPIVEKEVSAIELLRRIDLLHQWDLITWAHSWKVGALTQYFARFLGLAPYPFWVAGVLHDLGKFYTPGRQIFLEARKLSDAEWENIIKSHSAYGWVVIQKMNGNPKLRDVASIGALTHQEKWNGSGYPQGLEEEEIPFIGRLLAICDVFEALTANRPYKKQWSLQDALKLIRCQSGLSFDPVLAEQFLELPREDLKTFVSTKVVVKT